jgi:Pre-mRNA-splicing factor SF3A3, of SF3a complex, Prp9
VEFSGEEALGRFLDVHEHYNRFINSKFGRQLDYAGYLAALDAFEDVPRHLRASKPYRWISCFSNSLWILGYPVPRLHSQSCAGAARWQLAELPTELKWCTLAPLLGLCVLPPKAAACDRVKPSQ